MENPVKLSVKFNRESIDVQILLSSTVKDLKNLLQPLTNVLPTAQRLIANGKVLRDDMTLVECELIDGHKLFLLTSVGQPQCGPILMEAPLLARSDITIKSKTVEEWKTTGVIALALFDLKEIPAKVWACGSSTRVLDVSYNSLEEVPDKIGSFTLLQELKLNSNNLRDCSICWESVAILKSLTILILDHNQLTLLPSQICTLTSLRQLDISHNSLKGVPDEIGLLTSLEIFKASNNRITYVSPCIGTCVSLIEVNLASNIISVLPLTFSDFKDLKQLNLSSNWRLKTLPSTLFKSCPELIKLDLQNTRVTDESLRQYEGWLEFSERNLVNHMRQPGSHPTRSSSPKSDEDADENTDSLISS